VTKFDFVFEEKPVQAEVQHNADGSFNVTVHNADKTTTVVNNVKGKLLANNRILLNVNDSVVSATVVKDSESVHIFTDDGERIALALPEPEFLKATAGASAGSVITPMPCKITQVLVKAGDTVKADQPLLILEAMKMEHVIRAPFAGVVERVSYKEGDLVPEKTPVVVLKEA